MATAKLHMWALCIPHAYKTGLNDNVGTQRLGEGISSADCSRVRCVLDRLTNKVLNLENLPTMFYELNNGHASLIIFVKYYTTHNPYCLEMLTLL